MIDQKNEVSNWVFNTEQLFRDIDKASNTKDEINDILSSMEAEKRKMNFSGSERKGK